VDRNIINVENISLLRQDIEIIKNFSIRISSGEKINIFGKNGSGKTSLIKIIAGITYPSSGNISINTDLSYNKDVFYIGHKYGLKNELSVYDNLNYIMSLNQVNKYIDLEKELNFYDIKTSVKSIVKYLSHGQKKIISLIALTLTDNKLWILDEPFTGLDQTIVDKFITKINTHIRKSGSVVITSHKENEGFKNIELC
tara:strand:+ start:2506 stop:3099 length:594 start_codon:yes stop_codon:yes gene_type:complete